MENSVQDNEGRTWHEYEPDTTPMVPIESWGHDHFTTLVYAETRAVDYDGLLENKHMRCDPRLHREFANTDLGRNPIGGGYPTRLKQGENKEDHDDWSCLEDMAAVGWMRIWWHQKYRTPIGGTVAKVELTDEGWRVVHAIRRHMAQGKRVGEFVLEAA